MNKFARRVLPLGVVLASIGQAHAALPPEVLTAISTAGTDMVAAITAIIVAFVAFWGLKKLASKFGWA
jgi:Inovirus Coat protein B